MEVFAQLLIVVFSVATAYLVTLRDPRQRRWGYVLGLLGEPAWFWTTITHRQWGIAALCVWFTIMYIRGTLTHFSFHCFS